MDITSFLNQDGLFPVSVAGTSKVADNETIGIGGFSMYATLENSKDLTSTAPDVILEDGSIVSDTIFLAPVVVMISGVVSDIFINSEADNGLFSPTESIIGITNQYLPQRTQSQITKIRSLVDDAKNVKRRVESVIDSGKNLYNLFGDNTGTKTLQEQFLDAIEQVHFSKALIEIESPFRVYRNMRITSIKTTKESGSDDIKFSIEAKQIGLKKLKTITVENIEPAPSPSEGLQGATEAQSDKGTTAGQVVSETKERSLAESLRLQIFGDDAPSIDGQLPRSS